LYIPVIPALERVSEEDHKFEDSLDCIKRPCSKNKNKTRKTKLSTIFHCCNKEHTDPKIHVGIQETQKRHSKMKKKKKF
jgi:hypothetical protein